MRTCYKVKFLILEEQNQLETGIFQISFDVSEQQRFICSCMPEGLLDVSIFIL